MTNHSPILKKYAEIYYNEDYSTFLNDIRNIELNSTIEKKMLLHDNGAIDLYSFKKECKSGRYKITVDNVKFDCFYNGVSNGEYMYVFLSGVAINNSIFQRWSWNPSEITLAIADPMTTTHGLNLGWYYGTNEKDYRMLCSKIIIHIANIVGINLSKIIIYGSSGGATSALHIARYMKNCTIIAINPQIDIHSLQNSVNKLENKMNVKIDDPTLIYRNDLSDILKIKSNKYILLINCLSKEDFLPVTKLSKSLNHTIKFGVSCSENFCTWIFKAKSQISASGDWSTHNSQDYLILFELIDYLVRNNLIFDTNNDEILMAITKMWQDHFDVLNETLKYKTIIDSRHDPNAQYRLAKMYQIGDCVLKDEDLYKYWIDISSKNNYLSKVEKYSSNIEINYEKLANHLFEKAIEFIKINDDSKNIPAAIQYLKKAEYFGHPYAKIELVKTLWKDNAPSSLYEYYLICCEEVHRKNHEFEIFLARAYRDGKGTEKNPNLAIHYFRTAISHNIHWANCEMFDYVWSKRMKELYPEIIKYAEKRSSEGDPDMTARLALAYKHGIGVEIDVEKAQKLMEYASEHNVPWAKKELIGMNFTKGEDCHQ